MESANGSDRSARSTGRRVLVRSAVVLLAVCSAVALLTGSILAYDQVAILTPSPAEIEAEPGEEVVVSVGILVGGHGDDGVAAVDLVARYHPDHLEVRDVEAGPWLEGGDGETTVETAETVANADGTTILEAEREPIGDGVTGEGELAALTIAVDEDAEPGRTTIDFAETDVELASDWPMPVHDRGVTVSIDGSDEPVEPFDHPDPDDVETESSGPGADEGENDENTTGDGDDADGNGDDGPADDDAIPGTLLTTILAGLVLLAYAAYRRS